MTLGSRASGDDVVDLLAACHRRIREHIVMARRLGAERDRAPSEEVRETAARIVRYFTVALPLHAADEDELIAPRLAAAGKEVVDAVGVVERDHVDHQPWVDALVDACREPVADGLLIGRAAERLALHMAMHLDLEETVIFPAVRALPASERAAILEGMKLRRSSGT